MQGILNWKRCKKCGEPFDVGTNYDECPGCRKLNEVEGDGEKEIN